MQFGFPKSLRILKSAEFDRVFSRKCSLTDGLIILYIAESEQDNPRIGLVVSRKCGNAVTRNRWKRALRESFRIVQHDLPRNVDLVVLPRPGAKPDVKRLQNSLKRLASRGKDKLAARDSQGQPK